MIWQIHWTMRPQLLALAAHYCAHAHVVHIRSPHELHGFIRNAAK
jgi:hypothetical protein